MEQHRQVTVACLLSAVMAVIMCRNSVQWFLVVVDVFDVFWWFLTVLMFYSLQREFWVCMWIIS
jgi:hypothetical protein